VAALSIDLVGKGKTFFADPNKSVEFFVYPLTCRMKSLSQILRAISKMISHRYLRLLGIWKCSGVQTNDVHFDANGERKNYGLG